MQRILVKHKKQLGFSFVGMLFFHTIAQSVLLNDWDTSRPSFLGQNKK